MENARHAGASRSLDGDLSPQMRCGMVQQERDEIRGQLGDAPAFPGMGIARLLIAVEDGHLLQPLARLLIAPVEEGEDAVEKTLPRLRAVGCLALVDEGDPFRFLDVAELAQPELPRDLLDDPQ